MVIGLGRVKAVNPHLWLLRRLKNLRYDEQMQEVGRSVCGWIAGTAATLARCSRRSLFDRTLRNEVQINWSPTKTARQTEEAKAMMEVKRKKWTWKKNGFGGGRTRRCRYSSSRSKLQEQFKAPSQMGRGIAAQCDTRQCAYRRSSFLPPLLR